jgi:hypothetical protein
MQGKILFLLLMAGLLGLSALTAAFATVAQRLSAVVQPLRYPHMRPNRKLASRSHEAGTNEHRGTRDDSAR